MSARVLIIDNYDSFTHNLYQQVAVHPVEVRVVRNDAITLEGIRQWAPTHVILSPGPGHPANERDFGVCGAVIDHLAPSGVPTLGVCLGHQGIVERLGGQVVQAPEIVHGKTGEVEHHGVGLFAGLSSPMTAMRYHSLIAAADSIPEELEVTATLTRPGAPSMVMAVRHRRLPLYGVQFHPESVGTPEGDRLIANFLQLEAHSEVQS